MQEGFFQFFAPTKIIFQAGISRNCAHELQGLGLNRVLIVTDKVLVEKKLVVPIIDGLKAGGIEAAGIFSEVPPNSELFVVNSCATMARDAGVDGLLAIGGGSVMDTAKAAAILLTHGGDLVKDYSGAQTLPGPLKPLACIPTTAGTGSEVTNVAMVLDQSTHTKLSFLDDHLYPALAILDPEVTVSMPPKMTAATGMDALTHAIEAYTSIQSNPISDALAMKAVKLIRLSLLDATQDGKNLEARSNMLAAATMAALAFNHSMVGVIHGLSHAAGGLYAAHHGTLNSIFLPWGMEYNFEVCKDRYALLAARLGMSTTGLSRIEAARAAIDWIRELRRRLKKICGLEECLTALKVREEDLPRIAQGAVDDGTSFYNPREVIAEELLPFVQKAY